MSAYAADYKHLQIRMVAQYDSALTGASDLTVRFNADSANNYSRHYLKGDGTTITNDEYASVNSVGAFDVIPGNGGGATNFGVATIDILDFSAGPTEYKNTTVRVLAGALSSSKTTVRLSSGVWRDTAAVTSVYLGDTFATNSRFSIYGVR